MVGQYITLSKNTIGPVSDNLQNVSNRNFSIIKKEIISNADCHRVKQ